ncbi:MAG: hypothetical protein PHS97_03005 [Oscillospiraceae bacterium]|nr:hypothetical protein [Oscillospiraceae bacterium]
MSFPNIPDVDASVSISIEDSVNLLLASVAFEELGLAHLINAEAEKLQYVLGTIEGQTRLDPAPTLDELLQVNHSVDQTLRDIIKKEMLLEFKLEDVLTISTTTTSTTTTSTTTSTEPTEAGSAWSVGTDFGTGNAQYTSIGAREPSKTVDLGLGHDHTDIGSVAMVRSGSNLLVTISTVAPYTMDEVHLYLGDVPPTHSAPGLFPYHHTVTNPADYFTSYTFTINVSEFTGKTIYVAAHAHVYSLI